MQRRIFLACLFCGIFLFFYFRYQVYYTATDLNTPVLFVIENGEKVDIISKRLEEQNLISGNYYFLYYYWKEGLRGSIIAGEYSIGGRLTIPEIVQLITTGNTISDDVRVTFPEGWTASKMADRLTVLGFSGDEFLTFVSHPPQDFLANYEFLPHDYVDRHVALEGYLFPDTYIFHKDASIKDIVTKMLTNFDKQFSTDLRSELLKLNMTIDDSVILASIVENEVRSFTDRQTVAGIFNNRLSIDQPLQSDVTVSYILGTNKVQHSISETQTQSVYNTYINKGLPPGPVSNPGRDSLRAVIYPQKTNYFYFLSNPKTGETYFAVTFDEHKKNKVRNGL